MNRSRYVNPYLFFFAVNLAVVPLAWRHPFWLGACVVSTWYSAWEWVKVVLKDIGKRYEEQYAAEENEVLSTESMNYRYGWADGWNACRSAEPENRVFIRADKIK